MSDDIEILTSYINAQWAQARQSEDHRASYTRYIVLIALAMQGYVTEIEYEGKGFVFALIIAVIGMYGILVSAKYYERFRLHVCRIGRAIEKIEDYVSKQDITEIELLAAKKHREKHACLEKVRLNWLWIGLHIAILALGVFDMIAIISKL